ncbi:MAG: hypothetical protein PHE01_01765 [Methanosarcina sp.]|nr:hypothetical protein [Methanosarcina sp.]
MKATAFTNWTGLLAASSACTLTRLKSYPKRGSIYARVAESSGWPGELKTSCTIGGTKESVGELSASFR